MQTEIIPTSIASPKDSEDDGDEIDLGNEDLDDDDFGATGIISSGSSGFASDEHHIDTDDEIGTASSNDDNDGDDVEPQEEKDQAHTTKEHRDINNNVFPPSSNISAVHKPPRPSSASTLQSPSFIPRRHPNRVLSTRTTRVSAAHDETRSSEIYGGDLNSTFGDSNGTVLAPGREGGNKGQHGQTRKTSGGGKLKALKRASMTFYKSLRIPGAKVAEKEKKIEKDVRIEEQVRENREYMHRKLEVERKMDDGMTVVEEFLSPEKRIDIQRRHRDIVEMLDDELSTLKRLLDKSVDLTVCKTVTRRTLDTLYGGCLELLGDYAILEERVEQLVGGIKNIERETAAEVAKGERMLIDAKVELAESQSELLRLQLGLANLRREAREAKEAQEAKSAAEGHLRDKRKLLSKERSKMKQIESRVKDLEGDWDSDR